jgi:hypothetical protein
MNKPSENKTETTITSQQPSEQPAQPATGEVTNKEVLDGELDKVAGGAGPITGGASLGMD